MLVLLLVPALAACEAIYPYQATSSRPPTAADGGPADARAPGDAPAAPRDAPPTDRGAEDREPPADALPPAPDAGRPPDGLPPPLDTGTPADALPPVDAAPDTGTPADVLAPPPDAAPAVEAGGNCYNGTRDCSGCPVGLTCIDDLLHRICRCSSAGSCTMGPCMI